MCSLVTDNISGVGSN